MNKNSSKRRTIELACVLVIFMSLFLLVGKVSAEEPKIEKILTEVMPENSFWLDNDTLILKKYENNCGVYVIKFGNSIIKHKIEHTCHWLPLANPLKDTIMFRMLGDRVKSIREDNATYIGKSDWYAYNYRTGLLVKAFLADGDEIFVYDKKKNAVLFQSQFKEYTHSLPFKAIKLDGFEDQVKCRMVADGNEVYVFPGGGGGAAFLEHTRAGAEVQLFENNAKVKIFDVLVGNGKAYLVGSYGKDECSVFAIKDGQTTSKIFNKLCNSWNRLYYAKDSDSIYVDVVDYLRGDVYALYKISNIGEIQFILNLRKEYSIYSVSPGGDKFLMFSERFDSYGTLWFDAKILFYKEH